MAIDIDDVSFSIHIIGETTGDLYVGEFKARKRISHRLHLDKDRMRRELLGNIGGASTERALTTAELIADLSVRLTKSPSWWKESGGGLELCDDGVLGAVYEKAIQIEKDAAEEVKKKAQQAQADLRKDADKDKEATPA